VNYPVRRQVEMLPKLSMKFKHLAL
jgi:hypothetical protein